MKGSRIIFLALAIYVIVQGYGQPGQLCEICECRSTDKGLWVYCTSVNIEDIRTGAFRGGRVIQMENITIRSGNLTQMRSVEFPPFRARIVDLNGNEFHKNILFGQLAITEVLDLSHSKIANLSEHVFEGSYDYDEYYPMRLKVLNLRGNELSHLHQKTFAYIFQLEELDVSFNPLRDVHNLTAEAIALLPSLTTLRMAFTQLHSLPLFIFKSLKNLTHLDISGNYFVTFSPALEKASALKSLNFDENLLDVIQWTPNVSTLISLRLSRMPRLRVIGPNAFAGFPNLNDLHLSNNSNLSLLDENAFLISAKEGRYLQLKQLYLDHNNLTAFKQSWMPKWDDLNVLNLGGNPWNCNCDNYWLISTLLPRLEQEERKRNRCATPAQWANVELSELLQKDMGFQCPSTLSNSELVVVIMLVILIIFTVTVGAIFWKPIITRLCRKQIYRRNNPM